MTSNVPPIPVHLAALPTVGGLVVPRITPQARSGQHLFGTLSEAAQHAFLLGRRCQICGTSLPPRAVLFARTSDLALMCTSEPATCPPCAHYSALACPMLNGQLRHYRAGPHPTMTGVPPSRQELARRGAPAESWFAVWVRTYAVIDHPARPGTLAASWHDDLPLRVRPVPALTTRTAH
ncbi:MAG TPA: hypothetical protein VK453_12145 [Micromonosporaceae bacterium]|nr:hypothetical protein [Micromonosporaceae bacterium]